MNPAAADFSIREASLSDLKVLVQIIRESFADVALRFGLNKANCPRHPSNCTPEWIESALEKGITYFLMVKNGAPCGCVAIEHANRKICYLERLAVLPEYRKCGCGRALVDYALSRAWRDGAQRVEIGIISDDLALKECTGGSVSSRPKELRFRTFPSKWRSWRSSRLRNIHLPFLLDSLSTMFTVVDLRQYHGYNVAFHMN